MATIRVDQSRLKRSSNTVSQYLSSMKSNMRTAQQEISRLSTEWQGKDATQFAAQWDQITSGNSSYNRALKALESYANYLKMAEKEYKNAQSRAINRANALPRY